MNDKEDKMANNNKTVAEVLSEISEAHEVWKRSEIAGLPTQYLKEWHDRIEAAHKRDREAARRRAERSAIINMLESFPQDWACNPEAVQKWLALWQKCEDDLCEGGNYAE